MAGFTVMHADTMAIKIQAQIKIGRPVGYHENNRVWGRGAKSEKRWVGYNFTITGDIISPAGNVWRPCGLHFPGILLVNWQTGQFHSVAFATITRMRLMNWKWVPDKRS